MSIQSRFTPLMRRAATGFTLIELMVVLVIIGVLAALIVPNVLDRADDARSTAARTDVTNIMQALKLYRLDNQRYPSQEQGLQVEISLITDGAEIAEHYTPGFDIIFMDVEMPRLDGFGAAEAIRAVDADVVLVFVTNMAQYAIRGYEVDALDYVLKPVNYYQFCTKLSRAIQRVQRRRGGQVVLQLAGGGIQLLDTADIYYLETHSRMLYYHTSKGEFAARASLQSAEKQLAEYHFVRCNQCYLVNLAYVKGIENDFALVKNDRLEISRRQRTAFLTAVASYMGGVL